MKEALLVTLIVRRGTTNFEILPSNQAIVAFPLTQLKASSKEFTGKGNTDASVFSNEHY